VSLDARDSPTIQRLLERLPEFRPTFDAFVAEEEGEFGSFWAMNELIWTAVCQAGQAVLARRRLSGGCVVGWVGGGPAVCGARRAVRLIFAGPGGRRTVVRRGGAAV